jgi:hypothetical protein
MKLVWNFKAFVLYFGQRPLTGQSSWVCRDVETVILETYPYPVSNFPEILPILQACIKYIYIYMKLFSCNVCDCTWMIACLEAYFPTFWTNRSTTHSLAVNTLWFFWPHPLARAPCDFQNQKWRHKSVHLQDIEPSLSWIGHSACLVGDHYELHGTAKYLSPNSFCMSLLTNKTVLTYLRP